MRYLSVFDNDEDILQAFSDIFLKSEWFDADITYSKGIFYKNSNKIPKIVSDLKPLYDYVIESDCQKLQHLSDNSLKSIVFDPPFLFRNRKSDNNDKMSERFSYFKTFEDLINMYGNTLVACNKKLMKNGYLFFKCQDMTDGKFYCTHNYIINMALKLGYQLKDIGLKVSKSKLQKDAKQQNCLAKVHSYWLVFKKV